MSELVARTGRHQQRYEKGCRLVAGCIPFKYRICDESSGVGVTSDVKIVEVLMINSTNGPGLLFPKGGWENDETVEQAAEREALEEAGVRGKIMDYLGEYFFKSKTLQDDSSPEGMCKAAMFALLVDEELQCWPEQSTRQRSWLSIPEAMGCCRYPWMREALEEGFIKWHANYVREEDHATTSPATSPGH